MNSLQVSNACNSALGRESVTRLIKRKWPRRPTWLFKNTIASSLQSDSSIISTKNFLIAARPEWISSNWKEASITCACVPAHKLNPFTRPLPGCTTVWRRIARCRTFQSSSKSTNKWIWPWYRMTTFRVQSKWFDQTDSSYCVPSRKMRNLARRASASSLKSLEVQFLRSSNVSE